MIANPILPGFHADPSICRVPGEGGDDYYIATSTFEWWPGVRIHHSKDLVNWRHHSYAVTRTSQLDLNGHPDSAGVWAPCLTYSHGQFWLIYTDVRSTIGAFKDTHNYLITAPSIDGPWSEPIYLNSSGFDPSLFHDADGKPLAHQPAVDPLAGQAPLQRHPAAGVRPRGQEARRPDQEHLRRHRAGRRRRPAHLPPQRLVLPADGRGRHLLRACRHAWPVRANIDGPYETLPGNPLLTAWQQPTDGLQRSGHASLVSRPPSATGTWPTSAARPLEWSGPQRRSGRTQVRGYEGLHCPLGRETGIAAHCTGATTTGPRSSWRQWSTAPRRHRAAESGLPEHAFSNRTRSATTSTPPRSARHLNSLRVPFDETLDRRSPSAPAMAAPEGPRVADEPVRPEPGCAPPAALQLPRSRRDCRLQPRTASSRWRAWWPTTTPAIMPTCTSARDVDSGHARVVRT